MQLLLLKDQRDSVHDHRLDKPKQSSVATTKQPMVSGMKQEPVNLQDISCPGLQGLMFSSSVKSAHKKHFISALL